MTVRQVAFHLTDRCNLNCKHCLRDPDLKPLDLDVALVERVLDQAKDVYRIDHVALTGGEPMLHPRFADILDAIAARGMTWHMVTNGAYVDTKLASLFEADPRRRAACSCLDLSLDGADEAVHDRVRGAGSYRQVMRAAMRCRAEGLPFVLQMTLNRWNRHQIEQFGMSAAQLGAERVSFSYLQPTGTHLDDELSLSTGEWKEAQARVERLSTVLTVPVIMPEGFWKAQPFHVCEPFRSGTLHVDVQGRLNLCCMHSGVPAEGPRTDVLADLRETELVEGHRRMLRLIDRFQQDKLSAVVNRELSEWDEFPCNYCLKYFGKPHWTASGTGGAAAERPRWRGAWADDNKRRLQTVRDGSN